MTLREIYGRITVRERRVAAALTALIVIVTLLPPLWGAYQGSVRGETFNGIQFLSPGDMGVYLSQIDQAREGAWLFENRFTTETLRPTFNLFWLLVGRLAALFGISALAAFHLTRLLLIPLLAAVAYLFITFLFGSVRRRMTAFIVFMLGSGLGYLAEPFFRDNAPTRYRYEFPIDLWVGEANAFLSMGYSPHFVASWALFLLCLLLLMVSWRSGRLRHAVAAGLTGLILFQFHPFHAITLYAVPAIYLLSYGFGRGRRRWSGYAIFVALSVPSVIYHYVLTHYGPEAQALVEANLNLTPAVWHLLLGFGAVSLLWIPGLQLWQQEDREGEAWRFLLFWLVTQSLLVYAPLTFQRRLLEGLQFPLVMLSVPALLYLWDAWSTRRRRLIYGPSVALLVMLVFLLSSFGAVARNLQAYSTNNPPAFFFDSDTTAALDWIRTRTGPEAVFLASLNSGNFIAGWAGRRVYAGHWVNTIDLDRKEQEIAGFYSGSDPVWNREFLDRHGITHVFMGPAERLSGDWSHDDMTFDKVYGEGEVEIYHVGR
ncbi:hypothetical protein AMJ57_04395 [Parcubacteria bacterium SG8_24]|nr:MAG: hypothetical protein AMJ57_04395 [Parcubacteria bacterium SG8_24]